MSDRDDQIIRVYWQPGCSSCVRLKEFLTARAVAFESVDVAAEPGRLDDLARFGLRTVPVVTRGDGFVFGQVLGDVSAFLGIDGGAAPVLDPATLVARAEVVLTVAEDAARQFPDERLDDCQAGRDRSHRELAHHIFRVVEAFLETVDGGALTDASLVAPPPAEMRTSAQIGDYGRSVRQRLGDWWVGADTDTPTATLATYYGPQSLHSVLERTTWHAAQHTRQLLAVLDDFGIAPTRRLTPTELRGLPLPREIWQ